MKPKISDYWLVACIFMLIKLCLHLLTNTHYELHRDEMLYFNQGEHLAWGYATVPPMTGFISFLIKSVFGYSVFGIRLLPAIMGVASMYLIARIVQDLGGKILALAIACSAFLLSPGFLIFNTLYTVNVFEQFFWLLISYLFFMLITTGNEKLWLWIGLFSGLAFLNKYLVVYLLAGFCIAILLSPKRSVFRTKYFVWAMALGFAIVLPNIYWQYSHNWPVVFHINEIQKSQMANMTYLNYFIDIFLMNGVSTIIWLFGLAAVLFFRQERKYRFMGVASAIIILMYALSNGKAYYMLGLIPFLFASGGHALEKYFQGKLRFVGISALAVSTVFSIISLPFGLPVLSFPELELYAAKTRGFAYYPFLRWEDGKIHPISQVYSDMTGWKELTGLVAEAYDQIPENEKKDATIYVNRNYGIAGAIHFYGKAYNLPEPVTFLDSYVLWAPDTIPNGKMIYIFRGSDDLPQLFQTVTEIGSVDNKYFRENGLKVFLCSDPIADVREIYRKKAMDEKGIYR